MAHLRSASRPWTFGLAVVLLVLTSATAAGAVGVAGVDLTVDLPQDRDGRPQLAMDDEPQPVQLLLRNGVDHPRTVSLYVVAASPGGEGSFGLAGPGSADWFGLEERTVTLEARERRTIVATPRPEASPEEATHLAVVLEAGTDSTVVTRAARVVELTGPAPGLPPRWLLVLATGLLTAAVGAHAWHLRGDLHVPTWEVATPR